MRLAAGPSSSGFVIGEGERTRPQQEVSELSCGPTEALLLYPQGKFFFLIDDIYLLGLFCFRHP